MTDGSGPGGNAGPGVARDPAASPAEARQPGNVLLVEDNMIIALDCAEMLHEMGIGAVTTASGVAEALDAIAAARPDMALLDVNLGRGTSLPVAQRLSAEGVPFALSTGYGGDPEALAGFPDAPVLRKPFGQDELRRTMESLRG